MKRHTERRVAERRPADAGPGGLTLALRTGTRVEIIDMSAGGALVETSARLEPGTSLAIRAFSTWTGVVRRATVIHCRVWSMNTRFGVRFRAGLRFETGSDYTATQPPRVSGNVLPIQSRHQVGLWAERADAGREPRPGTRVGYPWPR